MALEGVLVDRARMVTQVASTEGRVRGQTRMAEVTGAWFAAFLQLPQAGRSPDAAQGRRRVVTSPTLMFDVFDEENEPVVVNASMRIEVESDRFGHSMWETTGDPEPLASLVEVLGYQVTLKRVTDHEFTTVRP